MPTRPAAGIDLDRSITRLLAERTDRFLGVYADVVRPGTVRVGDVVQVHLPEPPSTLRRATSAAGQQAGSGDCSGCSRRRCCGAANRRCRGGGPDPGRRPRDEVRVAADDELVTGPGQSDIEPFAGAFERCLLVDDQDDRAPLEALEAEHVAVEHLLGVPEAVPVRGVAAGLALVLLGMPGTGGQQRDILGAPTLFEEQRRPGRRRRPSRRRGCTATNFTAGPSPPRKRIG